MRLRFKRTLVAILACLNVLTSGMMVLCAYLATMSSHDNYNYSYVGMLFPIILIINIGFGVFWLLVKKRLSGISLLGILICSSSIRTYCPINIEKEIPDDALKILSYNVMGIPKNDTIPFEQCGIVRYIKSQNADFACIQEAQSNEYMNSLFSDIYPYIYNSTHSGIGMTFMSKYPVVDSLELSINSHSNGSWAFMVDVGGDTIMIINNHLESYKLSDQDKDDYKTIIKTPEDDFNEERYDMLVSKLNLANALRSDQTDSVYSCVGRYIDRMPIVCVGDFNAPSLSYTHYKLTRLLDDAYTRTGNGPGFSYHRSGMFFRIDNILVSPNITPFGAKVDNSIAESDHYPIFSYFKICRK